MSNGRSTLTKQKTPNISVKKKESSQSYLILIVFNVEQLLSLEDIFCFYN